MSPTAEQSSWASTIELSRLIPLGGIEGPALHDPCCKELEGGLSFGA